MKLIKPARLQPGMTVGVIAPASGVTEEIAIDKSIEAISKWGLTVKEGRHLRKRRSFLSATARERLDDLHGMFRSRAVDAVMCVRGGYGTMHLLEGIDYGLVQKNPKVFTGFSDITALALAFLRNCGLVTFNGPMLSTTWGKSPVSRFTVDSFLRTVSQAEPAGSIWQGHRDRKYRVVRHGKATGRLTGGNLTLVASTLGTPYEIDTKGAIVFLEEVDERHYKCDRYLTQLLLAGKLRDAKAIVFGRNMPVAEDMEREAKAAKRGLPKLAKAMPKTVARDREALLDEVIAERLGPLGIPVLIGLPFGHIDDYATLPLGVKASVDTRTGDLSVEESAVR